MTQTRNLEPGATTAEPEPAGTKAKGSAPPKPVVPRKVVCPVSGTVFNPRATGGRCPVCGEQVVPAEYVAQAVPVVSPVGTWLFQEGGWRLVALILLIIYQFTIFGVLWHYLATIHAL